MKNSKKGIRYRVSSRMYPTAYLNFLPRDEANANHQCDYKQNYQSQYQKDDNS